MWPFKKKEKKKQDKNPYTANHPLYQPQPVAYDPYLGMNYGHSNQVDDTPSKNDSTGHSHDVGSGSYHESSSSHSDHSSSYDGGGYSGGGYDGGGGGSDSGGGGDGGGGGD